MPRGYALRQVTSRAPRTPRHMGSTLDLLVRRASDSLIFGLEPDGVSERGLRMLVDSGSTETLIGETLARAVGLRWHQRATPEMWEEQACQANIWGPTREQV